MTSSIPFPRPYVLLTGATGMVGSQILARLLRSQVPVVVLARSKPGRFKRRSQSAAERIELIIKRFESNFGRMLKRPVVIDGDVNEPNLALNVDELGWLEMHCGQIIHSAASLSFRPAEQSLDNEPFRTNREGTERLASLCESLGISKFHYISTAYVCGERIGNIAESELNCGQTFSNDYERSKLQAEEHLRGRFSGQNLTVYRPSIVIDSTGLSPVWQDRTVYGAYAMFNGLATKFGLPSRGEWFRNLGLAGEHCKNLVEASWVADVVVKIFENESLHGRTYHVTARDGTSIEQMEDAFHMVTAETLSAKEARKSVAAFGRTTSPVTTKLSPLTVAQRAMMDAIAAPFVDTFLPYFRDDPKFSRDNIDLSLEQLMIAEQPEINAETLANMIRLGGSKELLGQGANEVGASLYSQRIKFGNSCLRSEDSASTQNSWGIIVSGPGGGDFLIQSDKPEFVFWGGESSCHRVYVSSLDWQALIDGGETARGLILSGRMTIEYDHVGDTKNEEQMQDEAAGAVAQACHVFASLRPIECVSGTAVRHASQSLRTPK